jgi:Fe-S-cluster containining protein
MNGRRNGGVACRRCGACCRVDMVAYVSPEDIQRWGKEGRHDIIERLRDNDVMWAGDQIINKFGEKVGDCIYLNWDGTLFSCEIYETRPLICRNFIPGSSPLCPQYHREG